MGFPSRRRASFGDQAVFPPGYFFDGAPLSVPKEAAPRPRQNIYLEFWVSWGGVWVSWGGFLKGLGVLLAGPGMVLGVLGWSWAGLGVVFGGLGVD